jgi:hypothetical protein
MMKLSFMHFCAVLIALSQPGNAQTAPSSETIVLSLKTMSKALAGCREVYTWVQPGMTSPLLKVVIGDGYSQTLMSLEKAEKLSKFLVEHPDQIKGGMLVAILSTSDDFSVGVGSTRTEILASVMRQNSKITSQMTKELTTSDINLNACQKSLFNAGDDYVELVVRYVAAEDRLVGAPKPH